MHQSRDEAAAKEVAEQVDQALTRQNAVIARVAELGARVKEAVEKGMEQIKPALLLAMQRTRGMEQSPEQGVEI